MKLNVLVISLCFGDNLSRMLSLSLCNMLINLFFIISVGTQFTWDASLYIEVQTEELLTEEFLHDFEDCAEELIAKFQLNHGGKYS